MAEQTFYQKIAREWWPAAEHFGDGRFACVARVGGRVEVNLYPVWGDARETADIVGGTVKRLPLPVASFYNDSFGYRDKSERNSVSA
ncbi:MAG: hypothetical protein WB711_08265 [Terriglobales bacterium]